ncbi:MoaD/ThiS family protein [Desulfoscipio gibsoniae]|uniref:ThiS family protein n=1 Tax=Desulfoscipio gibsoniae DSM 7213 TaxID=767817 RepID=R4KQK7_9FIRM|nr:MoaD/ThiS family protein [Desulfoscipio gibsoniae]AGL03827.1 ThiS family protein [Desulfoscipio gibsoniae DSM 7213]
MAEPKTFNVLVNMGIVLARQVGPPEYQKPKITLPVTEDVTLDYLINQLGIPNQYISFITVNGRKCEWSVRLKPNDEIILFPYITGG